MLTQLEKQLKNALSKPLNKASEMRLYLLVDPEFISDINTVWSVGNPVNITLAHLFLRLLQTI